MATLDAPVAKAADLTGLTALPPVEAPGADDSASEEVELGGPDPAAGIKKLFGLVSASDAFEVHAREIEDAGLIFIRDKYRSFSNNRF